MKYRYVAIEREYGSGGTEIAERLAKECGLAYYGKEILEAVANERGVSVESIMQSEESVSGSFFYTVYALSQLQSGNMDMLTEDCKLFLAEQEFIRKSAFNGPAVYLGHCAAEALKNFDVLRVYIYCSDKEKKYSRIREQYGIAEGKLESTQRRFDSKRSKYYYANTAKKWNDPQNYDILLNSASLGVNGCVEAIRALVSGTDSE